jgi:phenylacetic acid degradation operon negative regulatory protein
MPDVSNVLNRPLPDDPRLLLSAPFRAVHFVFGLFHPDVEPLSGRALLGSLAALGFGDEASRGIVLRLRRGGFLQSRRSGREAVYALSDRSRRLLDEIARRSSEPPPPWGGTFETLVVRVPDNQRAFREQLRRHASYAGFGAPMPGLLIAPSVDSTRRIEPLLDAAPDGVRIVRGQLAMDAGDAAALAAATWDLPQAAAALRAESARMEAVANQAERTPSVGADALLLLWTSIGAYFELLSEHPPLPTELVPPHWPMEDARGQFFRVAATIAAPARAFVQDLEAGRS